MVLRTPGQHKELKKPDQQLTQMLSSCTSLPLVQPVGTKGEEIKLVTLPTSRVERQESVPLCEASSCTVSVVLGVWGGKKENEQ